MASVMRRDPFPGCMNIQIELTRKISVRAS
jgi:hypothetical protein